MIAFVIIITNNYSLIQLISSTIFLVTAYVSICVTTLDIFKLVTYFYIICYYFQLRCHLLNSELKNLVTCKINSSISKQTKTIFTEHYGICKQIDLFNT